LNAHQTYGRRATDLLELEGRTFRPMLIPVPGGRDGFDGIGRHVPRVDVLARRVAELERTNLELAAFASDVAHDLRAPLQAVAGFAELLARREGARLDETSQDFVGHILSAAAAMRDMVEAVLEHRRSSCGPVTATWVDSKDLVTAVLGRFRAELDGAGAVVEIGDLPRIYADRVQLGRVFQNLLSNAIRATHPERDLRITITARRLGAAWEFAVTDNGVGVLAEDGNRIFELFQRGSGAAHTGSGTGMGLSICRAVVERHGGRIAVERAANGGARFSFTVPDQGLGQPCRQ